MRKKSESSIIVIVVVLTATVAINSFDFQVSGDHNQIQQIPISFNVFPTTTRPAENFDSLSRTPK